MLLIGGGLPVAMWLARAFLILGAGGAALIASA
jgi:hypothetical protein